MFSTSELFSFGSLITSSVSLIKSSKSTLRDLSILCIASKDGSIGFCV